MAIPFNSLTKWEYLEILILIQLQSLVIKKKIQIVFYKVKGEFL